MSTVQSGDRLTVCELKTSGRMPCNSNSAKSVSYYIYDAKKKRTLHGDFWDLAWNLGAEMTRPSYE